MIELGGEATAETVRKLGGLPNPTRDGFSADSAMKSPQHVVSPIISTVQLGAAAPGTIAASPMHGPERQPGRVGRGAGQLALNGHLYCQV